MARERMVTRTINVTEVSAMCVDVLTQAVDTKKLEISGDVLEGEKLLKAVKSAYETETLKVVAITETTTREELYGMKEIDFIKYAKKLDSDRKFIDEN